MSLDVEKLELLSPSIASLNDTFRWKITMSARGDIPVLDESLPDEEREVDIQVLFIYDPCNNDGEVVLEEFTIDSLKQGANVIELEHQGLPLNHVAANIQSDSKSAFGLCFNFRFRDQLFLVLGLQVIVTLAEGLIFEKLDVIEKPEQLVRNISLKNYRKTPRSIDWSKKISLKRGSAEVRSEEGAIEEFPRKKQHKELK